MHFNNGKESPIFFVTNVTCSITSNPSIILENKTEKVIFPL